MDTSDKIWERSLGGGDLLTHVIDRYRYLVISPEISQLVSYNKRYTVVNVFDVDITLAIASDTYDRITWHLWHTW